MFNASGVESKVTWTASSFMVSEPDPASSSHAPTDLRPRCETSCLPYRDARVVGTDAVLVVVAIVLPLIG
jgi:hypothetical protein